MKSRRCVCRLGIEFNLAMRLWAAAFCVYQRFVEYLMRQCFFWFFFHHLIASPHKKLCLGTVNHKYWSGVGKCVELEGSLTQTTFTRICEIEHDHRDLTLSMVMERSLRCDLDFVWNGDLMRDYYYNCL